MDNKTGGPAFPHTRVFQDTSGHIKDGMTLRDYFAGQAMQGLLAGAADMTRKYFIDQLADDAYLAADAMLKARE